MSMSKTEPKFYYLEGNLAEIFTAYGLPGFLEKREVKSNVEIEKDLYDRCPIFHMPDIKKTLEESYLPEQDAEVPNRVYYRQGDMTGAILKHLLGHPVATYDENDPEQEIISVGTNFKSAIGSYIDAQKKTSGISIFYRADKPEKWMIVVTKNTHLPKDQHKVYLLSSIDPKSYMVDDSVKVEEFGSESLQKKLIELEDIANSPAIGAIIQNTLNKDGILKAHPDLLSELFTGHLFLGVEFDENPEWMELLEHNAAIIKENPFIIALSSSLVPGDLKLSLAEIKDCLKEESQLSEILKSILDDELVKQSPEIKNEVVRFVHNLYQFGRLDKFSNFKFEKDRDFLVFFSNWAPKAKKNGKLELSEEKLEELRKLHGKMQILQNGTELMTRLTKSDDQLQLTDRLIGLVQFAEAKENEPKDEKVWSLAFQFILKGLGREGEYNKLIGFLNQAPGIEQIKPELLLQFLSENIDNNELLESVRAALATLVKLNISNPELYELVLNSEEFRNKVANLDVPSAQETLTKLDELKISDSKSYEMVLRSEGFRGIVVTLAPSKDVKKDAKDKDVKDKDVKKEAEEAKKAEDTRKRIELAKNLADLGHFSAFTQLSTNINHVNSFNQFVKNNGLKKVLIDNLSTQDVAVCKRILENPLLNALVDAQIEVDQTLVDKTLNPKNELTKKLQTITKETNPARKKALYQLAIDLDRIGVLGAFDKFEKDDNKFLEFFHKFVTTPNSKLVLSLMLSKDPVIGIDALRLMAYSGDAVKFFKQFLEKNDPPVNDKLNWLTRHRAEYPKEITSMAIDFLFKQPDIPLDKFKSVVTFLNSTPKSDSSRDKMIDFLSKHYNDRDVSKLFSEVTTIYKKLHALGVEDKTLYELALENKTFQDIVQHRLLPMNAADVAVGCGLKRVATTPAVEELQAYKRSNYILTNDNKFLYYDKTKDKLLTINLDESQLKKLKERFPQSIDQLKDNKFEQLTEIALLKKQNNDLIKLAGKLEKEELLDKYEYLASDTQLASQFVKFSGSLSIDELLRKELSSQEFSFERTKSILKNKRLIALFDAGVHPSNAQLSQLLIPASEKSKAMDILMLLPLNIQKKLAYQLAIIDSPAAKNFRTVLFDIDANKEINLEAKSKIIETLCSLQFDDKRNGIAGKDVFSLYLDSEKFRKIACNLLPISAGEEICGFFKMAVAPRPEEFDKYERSRFILTDNALLFYNPADKRLLTISVDKSQIAALNKKFAELPIEKLTNEQFKQLTAIVSINKVNTELTTFAYNLSKLEHLAKYAEFTDLKQISYFNIFCNVPVLKTVLLEKLQAGVEETKALLDSPRLRAMIDKGVNPTKELVHDLLTPEHAATKRLDILLKFNIKNQAAYKWVMEDSPAAIKFRAVLDEIDKSKDIKSDPAKAKMIETLCSLQLGDKKSSIAGKDVFSMYLNKEEKGEKFKASLFKIEETCTKITSRWGEEEEKAKTFAAAEQEYRKGLYGAVFDNLSKLSSGCDLYLMSELPQSSAHLKKNSYIFINTNDTRELYYIKPDGKYEQVKIDNFDTCRQQIEIKQADQKVPKLHLDEKQIGEIITANGGHIPFKAEFEDNIAKASQNMLSVVDVRRRSWLMAIVETLADALNVISFTGFKRATDYFATNSKRTTFFSQTTSGHEVRNLNESLKDPQKIMKEYKSQLKDGNEDQVLPSDGLDVKLQ